MPCRPSKPPVSQPALLASFFEHQAEAEREHDQRQMAEPADDKARGVTDDAGGERGDDKPGDRLAPAVFGEQTRRIGADAEERGMAERDDAGIAEDQIERQSKQCGDGDLARQDQIIGEQRKWQKRRQPERDLDRLPARARGK